MLKASKRKYNFFQKIIHGSAGSTENSSEDEDILQKKIAFDSTYLLVGKKFI